MEKYNLAKNKDNSKTSEIKPKATKRRYSLVYKKKILEQAEACTKPGELGALLRREGLASSTLHVWRVAEAKGTLASTFNAKRGPAKAITSSQSKKIKDLERENYKLKKHIEKTEALLELQKKIAKMMELEVQENSEGKQ